MFRMLFQQLDPSVDLVCFAVPCHRLPPPKLSILIENIAACLFLERPGCTTSDPTQSAEASHCCLSSQFWESVFNNWSIDDMAVSHFDHHHNANPIKWTKAELSFASDTKRSGAIEIKTKYRNRKMTQTINAKW